MSGLCTLKITSSPLINLALWTWASDAEPIGFELIVIIFLYELPSSNNRISWTFLNSNGGTLSWSEVSSLTHADGITSALADKSWPNFIKADPK